MIAKNKIISLTIIGLVIGFVLFLLMNTGGSNVLGFVPIGGVIGFIAGWIWQSGSEKSEA